jgi:hypothetical protein
MLLAFAGLPLSEFAVDTALHDDLRSCIAKKWTSSIQRPKNTRLRPAKWVVLSRMGNAATCSISAAHGHPENSFNGLVGLDGKPCFWNFESCSSSDYVQIEVLLVLDVPGGPLHPESDTFRQFVRGNTTAINDFEDGVMRCLSNNGHNGLDHGPKNCHGMQMRRPERGHRMPLCPFTGGVDFVAINDETCFPVPTKIVVEDNPVWVSFSLTIVLPIGIILTCGLCGVIVWILNSHRNADTVQKVNRPDNLDLLATDRKDFNDTLDERGGIHSIKSAPEQSRSLGFTNSVKAGIPLRALHSQQADYL